MEAWDFSHKNGVVGKIGGVTLKKGGGITISNINLYRCASLLAPECVLYVLWMISNKSTSKTPCVRPQ